MTTRPQAALQFGSEFFQCVGPDSQQKGRFLLPQSELGEQPLAAPVKKVGAKLAVNDRSPHHLLKHLLRHFLLSFPCGSSFSTPALLPGLLRWTVSERQGKRRCTGRRRAFV
ncbi:MAG TPA: hypothetical protein G4O00_04085 [Thermoflexia bacterium]|nr:hypothetical protein [Thermoflexia bacterium]